jgi:hypothetical protein
MGDDNPDVDERVRQLEAEILEARHACERHAAISLSLSLSLSCFALSVSCVRVLPLFLTYISFLLAELLARGTRWRSS